MVGFSMSPPPNFIYVLNYFNYCGQEVLNYFKVGGRAVDWCQGELKVREGTLKAFCPWAYAKRCYWK